MSGPRWWSPISVYDPASEVRLARCPVETDCVVLRRRWIETITTYDGGKITKRTVKSSNPPGRLPDRGELPQPLGLFMLVMAVTPLAIVAFALLIWPAALPRGLARGIAVAIWYPVL